MDRNIITLDSDAKAWFYFEQAIKGDLNDIGEHVEIVFDSWPSINIRLCGGIENSSLTAKNMKGLVALQTAVHGVTW
jgi:hypothetical protein